MVQRGGQDNLLSIILFLLVLSVLVIIHEFGHFIAARKMGVKVEKFSFGFGPKLLGIKRGETEYIISLVLLGGYVKMAGDEPASAVGRPWEFLSKSVGQRFGIIFSGPLLNYLLGFVLFWFVFFAGSPVATSKVGSVLKGYPAETSKILAGDRIIAVDGKTTKYWEELTDIIHNKKEGDLTLKVERSTPSGVRTLEMKLMPQRKEITDIFGKKRAISLIGIAPSDEIVSVRYGFFQSFFKASEQIYRLTTVTCQSLFFMITGKLSVKESVTGPIGIYMITTKAAQLGIVYLLQLVAILSASLAIFNLLPVPVLDGGHILFLLIEKIRGKPLSEKFQGIAMQVGLALLIALMLFASYGDLFKFVLRK